MTNTPTEDSLATVNQIKELTDAGSELVRVTVNNEISAENIIKIRDILYKSNYTTPIIGDFHYNAHTLLSAYPETAAALDKYRLNPGNIGGLNKFDDNFAQIIACDKMINRSVWRNWGSLSRQYLENTM